MVYTNYKKTDIHNYILSNVTEQMNEFKLVS